MHIENIVVGKPLVSPEDMFARDRKDWEENEKEKTYYTNEHFLPAILKALGVVKSTSDVKRNKPMLFKELEPYSFEKISW